MYNDNQNKGICKKKSKSGAVTVAGERVVQGFCNVLFK